MRYLRYLGLCIGLVVLMIGCSKSDLVRAVRIAATHDTAGAQRMATEKAVRYVSNPKALEQDIKQFQREFAGLMEVFRKLVGGTWGTKEVKEPTPKEYVKYTQNYLSRASVDFDQGIITVETLDDKEPMVSLKNAIVTTLLTPNDPRAVDLFSAKTVKLGETPFLYGEVKDNKGEAIRWASAAERYADYLIGQGVQTRSVQTASGAKTVRYVTITMVKDHEQVRGLKYRDFVERFAKRFSVSKNLVYAIIKTESDFNPYAVSSAPAFGLMQIVPTSAGQEVYGYLNKKDGLPSKDFLFVAENNIEYGAAYLHILDSEQLNNVQNPVSREYCVIAAYNTGTGNVFKTFDRNRKQAPAKINALAPLEVFETLQTSLPYEETRHYLTKVIGAKKQFVNF
jgi:membrane-bound lytic murein transglycosylase C